MFSTARLWLVDHMPAGMLFQPAEWFLAFLCVFSGFGTLVGGVESNSVAQVLPLVAYKLWGALLVIGGLTLLAGVTSIKRAAPGYVVTKVPAYRLGLRLLGISTLTYCTCLIYYAGSDGLMASVVPFAFALMCGVRLLSLGGRQ